MTLDPAAGLAEVRRALAHGRRTRAADLARAALREVERPARLALAGALLELFNAAPLPAGIVIALRALRQERDLAPGEGRRLFRLLDRTARTGLVDRYVPLLVRGLQRRGLPLRRAMILIWSTGRHQALVDFVRREWPAKFTDPQTFRFFAERSIQFGDHAAATPVLAALLAVAPNDRAIRDGLIRGLIERSAFADAATWIAGAPLDDATRAALDVLGAAIVDALSETPTQAARRDIRAAAETIQTLDPNHPINDEIAQLLPIADGDPYGASAAAAEAPLMVIRDAAPTSALVYAEERERTPLRSRSAKTTDEPGRWGVNADFAAAIDELARRPVRSTEALALRRRIEQHLAVADPSSIAPLLDRLLATAPRFAHQIAARFADPDDGVALFAGLDSALPLSVWRAAMALAERAQATGALAGFALRVASKPGVPLSALQHVGATVARACDADSLDAFWVGAAESAQSSMVGVAALRALFGAPVSPGFYVIAEGLLDGSLRGDDDATQLVQASRLIVARGWRWNDAAPLADAAIDPALSETMTLWLRAVIAWAQGDRITALRHLDAGAVLAASDAPVSFVTERALLNWRFGHWGAAAADLAAIDLRHLRGAHSRLSEVAALAASTPLAPDAVYPECLVDAVFDRPRTAPYAPTPHSVVTIITALGAGGSEKQTVSVLAALTSESRVDHQMLLVRSLEPEPQAFFLPRVTDAGVPYEAFGGHAADVAAALAAIGEDPTSPLATALDFLPEWLQSSTCQLVPLLRRLRPAAVHIRQDYVAAALACVLAGVPRVLLHRGSLSPDHWDIRPSQMLAKVRPMRHVYRRLLDQPGFAFINNSAAGLDTDRAWLARDDADRFHCVHNVVDFARLGRDMGPNLDLRASLGIPADAPVIGAAFRFQRVKRPLLWLAAARALLRHHPDAHFLIVGDGDLRAEMTAFAASEGFAERLHLPGTVEDVGHWYRAMTVALLTSDREGLPNLLIEAQHFGVPVLSTDVGGARETMDVGRTGRLVPADATPDEIAETLADMLADRAWHDAARVAAAPYVHERFGAATAVTRLIRLYGFAAE